MADDLLVIDASMTVAVLLAGPDGFAVFGDADLVAPPLLWPEVRSALYQIGWRGHLSQGEVTAAHAELSTCPILLDCRLVTLERRLRDRVDDPARVIGPTELA